MGIGSIGIQELLIIFFIILLIFGGSKIPGLAKGLGQGIREFKRALRGEEKSSPTKEIEQKAEETESK